MDGHSRVVIADRSELAANLYGLLLAPLGVELVVRKRFEEVRPFFFRRDGVKLGIFNSNIFGKKFDEIVHRIMEDEPIRNVKKIFICKENPAEEPCSDRLGHIPHANIVRKPFHPDEFLKLVERLLA